MNNRELNSQKHRRNDIETNFRPSKQLQKRQNSKVYDEDYDKGDDQQINHKVLLRNEKKSTYSRTPTTLAKEQRYYDKEDDYSWDKEDEENEDTNQIKKPVKKKDKIVAEKPPRMHIGEENRIDTLRDIEDEFSNLNQEKNIKIRDNDEDLARKELKKNKKEKKDNSYPNG